MRDNELFITDLAESLFDDGLDDVASKARRFIHRDVLHFVTEIRESFANSGSIKHVVLNPALKTRAADALAIALGSASFKRHHYSKYKIEISPLESLEKSVLRDFTTWLSSDDAARFHGWLVGWDGPLVSRQVQVARACRGDAFPKHIDMAEEGLAVVYNFTRGFEEGDGGVLRFPGQLQLPPVFNSVIVFRPKDAPHEVTKVTSESGTRFSVTAFFPSP